MYLVDILFHGLALDVGWFFDLVLKNLAISFMLFALYYVFFGSSFKKFLIGSLIYTFDIFVWADFGSALGIPLFVGSFLLINYIIKLSSLTIASETPRLKNKLVLVNEVMAILALLIFLVFFAVA